MDVTPPVWVVGTPQVVGLREASFAVQLALSEPGRTHYAVLPAGLPAPPAAAVVNGTVGTAVAQGSVDMPEVRRVGLAAL